MQSNLVIGSTGILGLKWEVHPKIFSCSFLPFLSLKQLMGLCRSGRSPCCLSIRQVVFEKRPQGRVEGKKPNVSSESPPSSPALHVSQ